jgi:hypothetical protein
MLSFFCTPLALAAQALIPREMTAGRYLHLYVSTSVQYLEVGKILSVYHHVSREVTARRYLHLYLLISHTHTCTHTHTHAHTHTHTHTHIYIFTCSVAHSVIKRLDVIVHVHTNTHVHTHTHVFVYIHRTGVARSLVKRLSIMSGILAAVMGAANWGVPTFFPGMFTQDGESQLCVFIHRVETSMSCFSAAAMSALVFVCVCHVCIHGSKMQNNLCFLLSKTHSHTHTHI